ncbi:MAG TPA: hypothetical protein VH206_13075 [Xanthobacteraceae bacterium]|jgi:hypothetical protein|nr:hypothetical protein [Xanthobacteraceae bacterium]
MVFHTRRAIAVDIEDTIYACKSCGAELIRTSLRQNARSGSEQKPEAA